MLIIREAIQFAHSASLLRSIPVNQNMSKSFPCLQVEQESTSRRFASSSQQQQQQQPTRLPLLMWLRPVSNSWLRYMRLVEVYDLLELRAYQQSAFLRAFELLKILQTADPTTTTTSSNSSSSRKKDSKGGERILTPHHILASFLLDSDKQKNHAVGINICRQLYTTKYAVLHDRVHKGNKEDGSIALPARRLQFVDVLQTVASRYVRESASAGSHDESQKLLQEAMKCENERLFQLAQLVEKMEVPPHGDSFKKLVPVSWQKLQAMYCDAKIDLAFVFERLEFRREALAQMQAALHHLETHVYPKQDHEAVATVYHNCGILLHFHIGDLPAAASSLEKAIAMRRRLSRRKRASPSRATARDEIYSDAEGEESDDDDDDICAREVFADSLFAHGVVLERLGDRLQGVQRQLQAANIFRRILSGRMGVSVSELPSSVPSVTDATIFSSGSSSTQPLTDSELKEEQEAVAGASTDAERDAALNRYQQLKEAAYDVHVQSNSKMLDCVCSTAAAVERLGDFATGLSLRLEAFHCARRMLGGRRQLSEVRAAVIDGLAQALELSGAPLTVTFPLKLEAQDIRRCLYAARPHRKETALSLRSVADSLAIMGKHAMAMQMRQATVRIHWQLLAATGAQARVRDVLRGAKAAAGRTQKQQQQLQSYLSLNDEQNILAAAEALLGLASSQLHLSDYAVAEHTVAEAFDLIRVLFFQRPALTQARLQHPIVASAYLLRGRLLLQKQQSTAKEAAHCILAALQIRQFLFGANVGNALLVEAAAALCQCPSGSVDAAVQLEAAQSHIGVVRALSTTAAVPNSSCCGISDLLAATSTLAFAQVLERHLFFSQQQQQPGEERPKLVLGQALVAELYRDCDKFERQYTLDRDAALDDHYDRHLSASALSLKAWSSVPSEQQQQQQQQQQSGGQSTPLLVDDGTKGEGPSPLDVLLRKWNSGIGSINNNVAGLGPVSVVGCKGRPVTLLSIFAEPVDAWPQYVVPKGNLHPDPKKLAPASALRRKKHRRGQNGGGDDDDDDYVECSSSTASTEVALTSGVQRQQLQRGEEGWSRRTNSSAGNRSQDPLLREGDGAFGSNNLDDGASGDRSTAAGTAASRTNETVEIVANDDAVSEAMSDLLTRGLA